MTPKTEEAAAPDLASKARPMLFAIDDPESVAVADELAAHCALTILDKLPEPGEIGAAGRDMALLVLCPSPAALLCRAMGRDNAPATALEHWRVQLKGVLTIKRQNRRAVHVIDIEALRRNPGSFLQRFELRETKDALEALSQPAEDAPDEIMLVLAWHTLNADIGDRALANEFDALTERLTDVELGTSAEYSGTAFHVYQQRLDERKELELLKDQQRSMFEQAETLYSEKLQAEQRLEQMSNGLKSYEAQVQELQKELARIREKLATKERLLQTAGVLLQDLEGLRNGLAQASEDLRQDNAGLRQVRQELERSGGGKDRQIEALTAEIDRMRHSRSYRLTAPLRRMRAALRGKGR